MALASWLPVSRGLTPHGLRHGHKTWMDEAGIADVLKSECLGHEEPGMRGVYGHVSPAMREELKDALQARWEDPLREHARLAERPSVRLLNTFLFDLRSAATKIGSHLAPKIGHRERRTVGTGHTDAL